MNWEMLCRWSLAALAAPAVLAGCVKVKAEHRVVEPIEINVNVRVQVEEKLSAAFAEMDAENPTLVAPPAAPEAAE
jgi:hypothetical protein